MAFSSRSFFIVSLAKSMEETDNTFAGQYLEWIRNLKGIPPFTHELLTQHLITDRPTSITNMDTSFSKIKWFPKYKLNQAF